MLTEAAPVLTVYFLLSSLGGFLCVASGAAQRAAAVGGFGGPVGLGWNPMKMG